jgi:beta-glucuronidase
MSYIFVIEMKQMPVHRLTSKMKLALSIRKFIIRRNSLCLFLFFLYFQNISGQFALTNIEARRTTSLNGRWRVVIDPFDIGSGDWKSLWKDKKPQGKHDFYEYSFDEGPELEVPGDFNSQLPELNYFESSVWYKKTFSYQLQKNKRLFIHFGGINYKADVYFNNEKIGSHEGGFTPFQFEITNKVKDGLNSLIVRTNNARIKDGIPGLGFDWFNYGGITRDVNLVETSASFIEDYFIQLKKGSTHEVNGWIKIDGDLKKQKITVAIPEAGIRYQTTSDNNGKADVKFTAALGLWSPEQPKLYKVFIRGETDSIEELIGFRDISVNETEIFLNGKSIFLKGVNIHEEIPQGKRRAYSESDALQLLTWAKELGCNFIRLAHYPHNEHTVKLAERMGLMVWEELPVYQGIDFASPVMQSKMDTMLKEMVHRDKNRCNIIIWSMSNETSLSPARYSGIAALASLCRKLDPTRLISSATDKVTYQDSTIYIKDTLYRFLDVIAVNEYLGWYRTWPGKPANIKWISDFKKPLVMSEFGGEALYGSKGEPKDAASSWSEEYQEKLYKDQLEMLRTIPFLRGTCPWILADFRSPGRMHPVYQNGWNRKGLISDRGLKKKAWFIMEKFYAELNK